MQVLQHQSEAGPRESQILALIRDTHIPGAMSYHYDRLHSFSAFATTQGTHYELYEAEEQGKTLGFTQITFAQVNWNGKTAQVSYSGDTRVAPMARGRGISNDLIRMACHQSVPVFGAVMNSNELVLSRKIGDWRKLGIQFEVITELKALFFRPKAKSSKSQLSHRRASVSDLRAMYELWCHYQTTRNLSRSYQDFHEFKKSYSNESGIELQNTLLYFRGHTLLAMMTLWDQSRVRKIVIDHQSRMIRFASKLFLNLPNVGEELKTLFSFQHAFLDNHPDTSLAVRALIDQARFEASKMGAHFFSLGLDSRDPILKTAARGAFITNSAKIILDPRGNQEFKTQLLPLHLEVGLG